MLYCSWVGNCPQCPLGSCASSRKLGGSDIYYYRYRRRGTKRPRHKSVVITNPTLARAFITVVSWFEYRSLSALHVWIQLTDWRAHGLTSLLGAVQRAARNRACTQTAGSQGVTPVEFRGDLWHQKTGVPALSCGFICVILRLAVLVELRFVTDRQTDDRHRPMASTADA